MEKEFWASVEGLLVNAEGFARDQFARKGAVMPMFLAVGDTGLMVIGTPWSGPEEKETMWLALRDKFREEHVERYAFIAEAWMAKVSQADLATTPRPSEHPQREEVVQVLAVDRTGKVRGAMMPILRDGDKARLGDATYSKPGEHQTGLLTSLLEDERRAN